MELRIIDSDDRICNISYYPNRQVQSKSWCLDNYELHRDGAPARLEYDESGLRTEESWYQYGKLHRADGPASIAYHKDGSVFVEWWYQHGRSHRIDGPALIVYFPDGRVAGRGWFYHGQRFASEEALADFKKKQELIGQMFPAHEQDDVFKL